MSMQIYNYLSRKIEEFKPISDEKVGMYTCGPTVYDYVHIGNWRTFVFEDVLKRVLKFNGYDVKHVMNITDIDDKIIKRANEERVDFKVITEKYERAFKADLSKLNIIPADFYPKATDNIDTMIRIIVTLLDKGIAYKGDDGVYFSVEKFPGYGRLSGLSKGNLKKGARINDDLYDKESWSDFALWKFPSTRSARSGQVAAEPSWGAPFGEGRPGWHIECSAMSMALLGESFDIHCGGVDLLFPHHENEIAQSESITGKKFVNFWLEGEHLLVDGQKMSKSLGNIYTLTDIIKKGFDPISLRYLFLTAHYRSKLNFTWESLAAAQNALNNLREEVSRWDDSKIGCAGFEKDFTNALNNDLDLPRAVATMFAMVKSEYPSSAKRRSVILMDQILGLGLDKVEKAVLSNEAKRLIMRREVLRNEGKFAESDKLRVELLAIGVEVEDTPEGSKWKKVKID